MSIYQETFRCWVLNTGIDPSDHADDDTRHFDTEADARDAYGEDAPVLQLPAPCWLVQCDGECEQIIDQEDEAYIIHHASRAEAEETARAYEWALAPDDTLSAVTVLAYCPEDAPPGCGSIPSPAEMESAGQMRLPGTPLCRRGSTTGT